MSFNGPVFIDGPGEVDYEDLDVKLSYFTFCELQERAMDGDKAAAAYLDARFARAQGRGNEEG